MPGGKYDNDACEKFAEEVGWQMQIGELSFNLTMSNHARLPVRVVDRYAYLGLGKVAKGPTRVVWGRAERDRARVLFSRAATCRL